MSVVQVRDELYYYYLSLYRSIITSLRRWRLSNFEKFKSPVNKGLFIIYIRDAFK